MTTGGITGATMVAGVVGTPISHSLSPLIHNAWLTAAGHDGVYIPFAPDPSRFECFVDGLRGGAFKGLNVTSPFKQRALELADAVDVRAKAAGAANLILFREDGRIEARNTDGAGLLGAFAEQAPRWTAAAGPVVVLGAGGAARGAIAALVGVGAVVRVVNRTVSRAQGLSELFADVKAFGWDELPRALDGASALISAAPLDVEASAVIAGHLGGLPSAAVVMDMVYTPIDSPLLRSARRRGLETVDGLAMLIEQAKPSFEALFGIPVPPQVDVRQRAEMSMQPLS